jgi:hypothetical protein
LQTSRLPRQNYPLGVFGSDRGSRRGSRGILTGSPDDLLRGKPGWSPGSFLRRSTGDGVEKTDLAQVQIADAYDDLPSP